MSCTLFLTGVKCKPGGGSPVHPHHVSLHNDFPAVPLERMHPVFCAYAGGVSQRLLGPQRKPDGEAHFTHQCLLRCFVALALSSM